MIIKYQDFEYDLGNATMSVDKARQVLAEFYPEVNLAEPRRYTNSDGKEVLEFVKSSGKLG